MSARPGLLLLAALLLQNALADSYGDNNLMNQVLVDCEKHAQNRSDSSLCRKLLNQYPNNNDSCHLVKYCDFCKLEAGFIQYREFQYCTFDNRIVPTILMVFWLIVLLFCFATIADSFFGPCLIALARSLRMNQNLAGVTLLAFGNGAPDVFSAISAILAGGAEDPDEGLGLGFLLGSGFLVNTVTAGLIILMKPFRMSRRPFLKDTVFYFSAVAWSASILIRRRMSLLDSFGFLFLYLIYVLVTWLGGVIRNKDPSRSAIVRLMFRLFPCCFRQAAISEASTDVQVQYFAQDKNIVIKPKTEDHQPQENGSALSKVLGGKKNISNVELVGQRRRYSTEQDPMKTIHDKSHPNETAIYNNNTRRKSAVAGPLAEASFQQDGLILRVYPSSPESSQTHMAFEIVDSANTDRLSTLNIPKLRRKRRNSKLASIDQELPYLVRWIIGQLRLKNDLLTLSRFSS
ncbi:hypothetical protein Ciccas_004285 [Cichlidogyrus casuarinus]|uniref:Sodium/calcium exchanger membrane region domain-containing protein n=1 Tax=Cichlidogyrus casuarinus TaxID=1844966 RepID=A0ABD2QCE5_9PLAT